MLSANKEKLQSFLIGSNQFIIPFFQRSFVWQIDNWSEIWDSIHEEFLEIQNGNKNSEHFIGTIIVKQRESERIGAIEYELIDGQQRLTTICLLLRAFYDVSQDEGVKNWIKTMIVFNDSYGNTHNRISHSRVDKEYFHTIILNNDSNEGTYGKYHNLKPDDLEKKIDSLNRIQGCYIYFRKRIQEEVEQQQIRSYVSIILDKLPVIHMALSKEDDVQQIFDTINSLGVRLTTAELLKNFLYSNRAVVNNYEEYWFSVFECDEDAVEFWNRERTSGRVIRTTVELFLYSYLIIIREANVKMEALFKEFKEHLKNRNDDELVAFSKDIHDFARVYQEIPDGENLSEISFVDHEKRFFHALREFEITTIFPFILYVYKKVDSVDERIKILRLLESYLTRRTICKLTTKNYNNLFLSLLGDAKKMKPITADQINAKLQKFTDNTNRFPDDEELKKAFSKNGLINKYSREVLYCIALYQLNHDYADNPKLNISGFSVEHIMPKKWRNNWDNLPETITEEFRDSNLLTLGNLTLVKGKLNSSMRDAAWVSKKDSLQKYSTLRLTTDYLSIEDWNEHVIQNRAKNLYDLAVQIWKK